MKVPVCFIKSVVLTNGIVAPIGRVSELKDSEAVRLFAAGAVRVVLTDSELAKLRTRFENVPQSASTEIDQMLLGVIVGEIKLRAEDSAVPTQTPAQKADAFVPLLTQKPVWLRGTRVGPGELVKVTPNDAVLFTAAGLADFPPLSIGECLNLERQLRNSSTGLQDVVQRIRERLEGIQADLLSDARRD